MQYQKSVSPLRQDLAYSRALGLLISTQLAGALYLHVLNYKGISPGFPRLIAALPVILLNLTAPLLFNRATDATTIVLVAFNTAWLSSFKILLWGINRSALSAKNLRASQFAAMLLAPLTPVSESSAVRGTGAGITSTTTSTATRGGRLGEEAAGPRRMFLDGTFKLACLGILARMLQHAEKFHPYPRAFLYGIALYFILSSIMDGPGAMFSSWLGIRVSPHFDQPWFSSSVVTFWSRRWDLAAGNVLRQLIYDPIVERKIIGSTTAATADTTTATTTTTESDIKQPQVVPQSTTTTSIQWSKVLGSSASFLTSGLVHECIFWYLTGHTSGGVWLSFFTIQIPIILIERTVLHYLKHRGIHVPLPLMPIWTISFVCISSARLFWAPAEKVGLVKKVISNVDVAYSKYLRVVDTVLASDVGRTLNVDVPVWFRTATRRIVSPL